MDRRVTRLAARQHGVVGRRQLFSLGLTEGEVDGLLRRRVVDAAARGVYVVTGAPPTPLQEPLVAALRCGPDALVVGPRILAAMAIPHVDRWGSFEVLVRPGRRVRSVPWQMRTDGLPGIDTAVVDGVPSCRWRRLAAESVVGLDDADAVAMLDHLRWWRPRAVEDVLAWAARHAGTTPAQRVRALAATGALRHESHAERAMAEVLAGFPVEFQVEVLPGIRVDGLLRAARIVLEYQGVGAHGSQAANERDRSRQRRLAAAGYHVVLLTAADLAAPAALRHRIGELIAARTA